MIVLALALAKILEAGEDDIDSWNTRAGCRGYISREATMQRKASWHQR
jgi:hypothetical protein